MHRLRFAIWLLGIRFGVRFGTRRQLRGVTVSVWARNSNENEEALDRLDKALGLIQTYAPDKFRNLRKDVSAILIAGSGAVSGCFIQQLKVIEVYYKDLLEETPGWVAVLLIHEAQHARLFRLGFGYHEAIRARIERICHRAEKNFALRLPGGEDLVSETEDRLSEDLDFIHSREGRLHGLEDRMRMELKSLEDYGCPNWLVAVFAWIYRRRLAKAMDSR